MLFFVSLAGCRWDAFVLTIRSSAEDLGAESWRRCTKDPRVVILGVVSAEGEGAQISDSMVLGALKQAMAVQ